MKVNLKSKKGFTLVELLAVIVILAVILAIAVPGISKLVKNSIKSVCVSDAKLIIKALELKELEEPNFDLLTVNEGNIKERLNIDNSKYKSLTIKKVDNKYFLIIIGQNKCDGLVVYGNKENMQASDEKDFDSSEFFPMNEKANAPVLAEGMTPIKWNGTTEVTTTENDPEWYDYSTKKWANAKTADGSYWVWIPRYIYKISSGWHSSETGTIEVQFSKGTSDNWNSSVIGNIDTGTTAEASNNKWTNHPAFTFGDTELTGFWVAKFQPTAVEGVDNYGQADNVITKTIVILPNVQTWRYITIGNAFTVSRNMETNEVYGWGNSGNGIDTHMMKNVEWGAVAYLSKSSYGKENEEIWINNSGQFTTGCAGDDVAAGYYSGCQNEYNTEDGVKASTTGNIYGIYDMAGGAFEYVAARINSDYSTYEDCGLAILNAPHKYRDEYSMGDTEGETYLLSIDHKGDALYETSGDYTWSNAWFGDNSWIPDRTTQWFERDGRYDSGSQAGPFSFSSYTGTGDYNVTFRPVLVVSQGL